MSTAKKDESAIFSFDEQSSSVPSVTQLIQAPKLKASRPTPQEFQPEKTVIHEAAPNQKEKTNIQKLEPSLMPAIKRSENFTLKGGPLRELPLLEMKVNWKMVFDRNQDGQFHLSQIHTSGHPSSEQLALMKGMCFSWRLFPEAEKSFLENGFAEIQLKENTALKEAFANPAHTWMFAMKSPSAPGNQILVLFAPNSLANSYSEIKSAFQAEKTDTSARVKIELE